MIPATISYEKNLMCVFIDIAKGLDTVSIPILKEALENVGVTVRFNENEEKWNMMYPKCHRTNFVYYICG